MAKVSREGRLVNQTVQAHDTNIARMGSVERDFTTIFGKLKYPDNTFGQEDKIFTLDAGLQ